MNGKFSKLVDKKQFGFITGEDGKEYFFYVKDLISYSWNKVKFNRKVDFVADQTPKGLRARNILILE